MIDTSKDLFWLVAACSLGLFTFFVCWGMYYLIMMLRNANYMVTSVKQKLELVDSILKLVKEKLEKTSSHMSLIADSVLKIAGYFLERQGAEKPKRKKS